MLYFVVAAREQTERMEKSARAYFYSLLEEDENFFQLVRDPRFNGFLIWQSGDPSNYWMDPTLRKDLSYRPPVPENWLEIVQRNDREYFEQLHPNQKKLGESVHVILLNGHYTPCQFQVETLPLQDDRTGTEYVLHLFSQSAPRPPTPKPVQQESHSLVLDQLVEKTPVMMHAINEKSKLVQVNDEWLEHLGYDRDEVIGRKLTDFMTPQSKKYAREQVLPSFFQSGSVKDVHYQMKKKSGEVIDVLVSSVLISDLGSGKKRSQSVIIDITEQVAAKEALKESEKRFRMLTETSQELICQHQPDGQAAYVYVSPSISQLTGFEPEELLGKSPFDFYHPDDARHVCGPVHKQVMSGQDNLHMEYRFRLKNGNYRWMSTWVETAKDGNKIRALITRTRDVEEQKQQEYELEQSREMLRNIAESVPGLLMRYHLDPQGRGKIEYISEGVDELWEMSREEVLRDPDQAWLRVHPEDREPLLESIRQAASGEQAWDHTYRMLMENGKIKWINGRGVPRKQTDGHVVLHSMLFDITQAKQAEEKLFIVNKQMEVAIATAGLGIWEYDIEAKKLHWNEQILSMYGLRRDDFNQKLQDWQERLHPEDEEMALSAFQSLWKGKEVHNVQFRAIKKRYGETVHILASGAPLRNDQGSITSLFGINIDITSLLHSQQALKESEERYRNITDSVPGAVMRYQRTTQGKQTIAFISKGAEEIFELSLEEINHNAKKLWQMVLPEDYRHVESSLKESANELSPWDQEWRIRLPGGRIKWLNGKGYPRKISNSEILWDMIISDITQIKNAEFELKEREGHLVKVTQNVPGAIFQYEQDPTGNTRFTFLSTGLRILHPMLNMDKVKDNPSVLFQKIIPEDRLVFEDALAYSYQNLSKWAQEYRIKLEDGRMEWHRVEATPERKPDGTVVWYGIFQNIDDKVRSMQRIEQLAQIAEKANDMLLTCNEHGKVTWANKIHEEVLGIKREEIIGYMPAEKLDTTPEGEVQIEQLNRAIRSQQSFTEIIPVYNKQKKLRWLQYNVMPIRSDYGKFMYSIISKQDLTDLIEKQEEMQTLIDRTMEQNTRLKEYSYITSHNIRSSVSRIIGLSQLMENDPGNASFLEMLKESANQLDVTINNINELLHLEKEFRVQELTPYDLPAAIRRVIELHRHQIHQKQVNLQLDLEEDLKLKTIPAYFDSIISNLFTNGLKYGITPHSKDLWIRLKSTNRHVIVEFEDKGIGMDLQTHQDRLFKLGSRLHDYSKGQGLGLFMVKRQLDVLGGTIEVTSQPQEGSLFRVKLPRHEG